MEKVKKILFVLLLLPIFLFGFNVHFASAQDNSALISQLEQEIQSLIKQIIALLQQSIQQKIADGDAQIQSQISSSAQNQTHPQFSNTNSGPGTLTVNESGVTAYVSINNGPQFAYASPISLNNGDTYSVTASSSGSGNGNSTSKCSGTASSGGSYVCNITINSY